MSEPMMSRSKYYFDKLSEWQKGYVVAILEDTNIKIDIEGSQVSKVIQTILTGEKTHE